MYKHNLGVLTTFVCILLTGLMVFSSHAVTENGEEKSPVGFSLMFEPTLVANSLHLTIANHGKPSRGFGFVEMQDSDTYSTACEIINVTVIRHPYNAPATITNPIVTNPIGDGEVVAQKQIPRGSVAKFLIDNGGGPKNVAVELEFSPRSIVSCLLNVNAIPVDEFGIPTGGHIPMSYNFRPVVFIDIVTDAID